MHFEQISIYTIQDELDSFMYQTVGHDAIHFFAECMNLPLFRREIEGTSSQIEADYSITPEDEVEDLYQLLYKVKMAIPDIKGVSVGAILSNYQRVRVENVLDQAELMSDMISHEVHAVFVKVAGAGFKKAHLGKSLEEMHPILISLNQKFGSHICGEGGEFETLTLDMPLFVKRIVLDEVEAVTISDDPFAAVAYLRIKSAHLEEKDSISIPETYWESLRLSARTPEGAPLQMLNRASDIDGSGRISAVETNALLEKNHVENNYPSSYSVGWKPPFLSIFGVTKEDNPLLLKGNDSKEIEDETKAVLEVIQDMSLFTRLNEIYGSHFKLNPATRVTVELPLREGCQIQVDCVACLDIPDFPRESMHVQSISYWAPANIGPYSQAIKVADHVYVAGQIGLIPNTMELAPADPALPDNQYAVSLANLNAIAVTQNCSFDDAALCVCYVSRRTLLNTAYSYWTAVNPKNSSVPSLFLVVPQLPRGAAVEWQVFYQDKDIANRSESVEALELESSFQVEIGDMGSVNIRAWVRRTLITVAGSALLRGSVNQESLFQSVEIFLKGLYDVADEIALGSSTLLNGAISLRVFYLDSLPYSLLFEAISLHLKSVWGPKSPAFSLVPVNEVMGGAIFAGHIVFSSFAHAAPR
ncbi:ATP binding domain 4 [Dinochytrium kinnereticum]|nr:ATP binding domain 4 [Dinochytrium kinnereticum]